ncbi:MAG: flotillin-like FloA family protein, partial [Planctomycetota bacterium]
MPVPSVVAPASAALPLLAQAPNFNRAFVWVVGIGIVIAAIIFLAIIGRYLGLWIQCVTTGTKIGLRDLVFMSLRKINPSVIVRAMIMAVQAGLLKEYPISRRQMQAHYLAG